MIKVKDLQYHYPLGPKSRTFPALQRVSLEVNPGEILGIIGPTGSGKSTLLKHLNALFLPQKGQVEIDGRQIHSKSKKLKKIRQKVAVVFQFPEEQLFSPSVREDLVFGPRNFGFSPGEIEETLGEVQKIFSISDRVLETNGFSLSGGERRLVALAGGLMGHPSILVLDEPTIGLDYSNRKRLLGLLQSLCQKGLGVVVVSHDLHSFWPFLDRLVLLEAGRVRFDGTRVELLRRQGEFQSGFFPDYVEELIQRGLLRGQEERALDQKGCLDLILEYYRTKNHG